MDTPTPIELSYVEQGSGQPVVLLHGFPLDRTMWDDQLPELARRYRVIAPDLRGHGESFAPPGPYTMAEHVADLRALLDRLGIDRVALVGLSMGGFVTMSFLEQYPERVWAAVLADTRAQADTDATKAFRAEQADVVQRAGMAPFVGQNLPRMYTPATLRDRHDLVDRYRRIVGRARPQAVAAALAGLAARADLTATLERITCPVLVVVGSEDLTTTPEDARLMAERIPGARLELIDGAGHLANIEAPERFTAVVLQFLEGSEPHDEPTEGADDTVTPRG